MPDNNRPEPGLGGIRLRWNDTIARSGKLKDVPCVVHHSPNTPCRPQNSRKGYRVRFGPDSKNKVRRVRGSMNPVTRSNRVGGRDHGPVPHFSPQSMRASPPSQTRRSPSRAPAECSATPRSLFLSTTEPLPSPGNIFGLDLLEKGTSVGPIVTLDAATDRYHADGSGSPVVFHSQDLSSRPCSPNLSHPPSVISPSPSYFAVADRCGTGGLQYLQFYIEKVVPRLAPLWGTFDNPFVSLVFPAVVESPILLHSLIALSISQFPGHGLHESTLSYQSLWHKNKAISLFRRQLSEPSSISIASVFTCIFMQTIEVLGSGTGSWSEWLTGAILMIETGQRLLLHGTDNCDQWLTLTKCVVAMDTFAAITTQHAPLMSTRYWNAWLQVQDTLPRPQSRLPLDLVMIHELSQDNTFEKLLGCPTAVMYTLGKMAEILRQQEITDLPEHQAQTTSLSRIYSLEEILLRWQPDEHAVNYHYHITEAFRHSALICFHRKIRRLPYTHPTVQYYVKETLTHLVAAGAAHYITITIWPLMIAAMEIDEQDAAYLKDVVRGHFSEIHDLQRNALFQNSETFLELLWQERENAQTWEQRVRIEWGSFALENGWRWCFW
ncbi:hypothetical protein ASPVEDRAFT_85852 [Aspergillus versicolor CBS 583.65]|uniref:Transcription factor domain-containing protein n=1 Tax=Aspergillus versicolor CBS 583.65 TaxID=1036611 RepID=A0A1L9PSE1_ASPVE|nr:uncharacterized protein ASPVEDRAFT_85852 [Aspergillus versicolor CBS 583.65]OJJ04460.1 hypothetical protein ASPVEDRAFT_85852 [Aspergillus versicolor CBS 583.65]